MSNLIFFLLPHNESKVFIDYKLNLDVLGVLAKTYTALNEFYIQHFIKFAWLHS